MSLTANTKVTRREWRITIPAGLKRKWGGSADWFTIDDLTQPIKASLNGEGFAVIRTGENQQDPTLQHAFETIEFWNDTAAPVTVVMLYGFGLHTSVPRVEIGNAVELGDDTIEAINPPLVTGVPTITIVAGIQAVGPSYGISVANTGAVPITVAGAALAPGESVAWSMNGRIDKIAAVAIDATGGQARAVWVA